MSINPGLALLLSITCPGAGQIYNREVVKGIVLILLFGLIIFLAKVSIFFGIGFIPLWIYGMIDAYGVAEEMQKREKTQFLEQIRTIVKEESGKSR